MAARLPQRGATTARHAATQRRPLGAARVVCSASTQPAREQQRPQQQHSVLQKAAALATAGVIALSGPAFAGDGAPVLCDAACESSLASQALVTTPSGLGFKDIKVGNGPQPVAGYQVVVNYVAMTEAGRVFENSLEKTPFDLRVGAGQVIPGLDEGLLSMRAGGVRRLYIPGSLSFPKALKAGPGRPSVPANSPLVFDVQLLYIPGLDYDEE